MSGITLAVQEALRQMGGRGSVLPDMLDSFVPVIHFADVGKLVPQPQPARALFSFFSVSSFFIAGEREGLQLRVKAPGGAVIESLILDSLGTHGWAVKLNDPEPGMGIQTPVQLGGPTTLSQVEWGIIDPAFTGTLVLPASVQVFSLEWFLPFGSVLTLQNQDDATGGTVGVVWREFNVVPGPA